MYQVTAKLVVDVHPWSSILAQYFQSTVQYAEFTDQTWVFKIRIFKRSVTSVMYNVQHSIIAVIYQYEEPRSMAHAISLSRLVT